MTETIFSILHDEAVRQGVDPDLVLAIAMVESGGNPWSLRYETKYSYFVQTESFAKALGISVETETACQRTSWGVMQIMGGVARELRFTGLLSQLCDPVFGVKYGVMHLASKIKKYPKENDSIAAYNGGSPVIVNGMYRNEDYVKKVLARLAPLRAVKSNQEVT